MKTQKIKFRRLWTRHPATRIKPSGKIYRRSHEKQEIRRDLKDIE